ncbi:MAG TPA: DNA-processing protein DprA [Solirubrobacteraceae bacterium]|jgi:DNA processing protein|nr:DNA-processing protein DprA [Solirubrobacteraceae bacterium]
MSGAPTDGNAISRRDPRYPAMLAQIPRAPSVLYVAGSVERMERLISEPVVAIVGTRKASDYGMETARGLARGLAASGVTVLSALAEGIAASAHLGALEVDGPTVTVMPGGADVCHPATRRSLYQRLRSRGCVLSEHPWGAGKQRWSQLARMRLVVGLAQMVIVVEAEEQPTALVPARLAERLDRTVCAVPGRVSSPISQGPHALLRNGAVLIRNPQDALDALYGIGSYEVPTGRAPLVPALQGILEHIGSGRDTLSKLIAAGCDTDEATVALAELELTGAVVRGDGGRYLPRG